MAMTTMAPEKVIYTAGMGELITANNQRQDRKMKFVIGFQIFTTVFLATMMIVFIVIYPKAQEVLVPVPNSVVNCSHTHSHHEHKPEQKENITTLYAFDPIAQSFGFHDGKYGHEIVNGSVYNRNSDIDFNTYNKGKFTVGVEGGRTGIIIDLGTSDDLQNKYKYSETGGGGQGFASIHRVNKTLLILKGYAYNGTFQAMDESKELFRVATQKQGNAMVNRGHIYLIRITDNYKPDFELIAKIIVIAYTPNESVTFRWSLLP